MDYPIKASTPIVEEVPGFHKMTANDLIKPYLIEGISAQAFFSLLPFGRRAGDEGLTGSRD